MKVTVDPNGVVSLEVSNGEAKVAIEFIRELQREHKPRKAKPHKKSRPALRQGDLVTSQFDALKYLAQNDSEEGISSAEFAKHANITNGAAGQRFTKLLKAGYVYRVKMGRYRAVKPPTA